MYSNTATSPAARIRPALTSSGVQAPMIYTELNHVAVTGAQVLLASKQSGDSWTLHAAIPYPEFEAKVNSLNWRFEVARRVVQSLRRKDNYMQLFVEYLQGELTKNEFKSKAETFVVTPRELDNKTLAECEVARELVGEDDIDSESLSVLLDLDVFALETLLRSNQETLKAGDERSGY